MNRQDLLQTIRERFSDAITGVYEKSAKRVYIQIQADSIVRFAQFLFKDIGARFNIASGVDGRTQMEILYHFTVDKLSTAIKLTFSQCSSGSHQN